MALSVMSAYLDTMVLVAEDELAAGVSYALHHEGVVIEPAAAAGVAALRGFAPSLPEGATGVILTGGWTSASDLALAVRTG